MLSSKFDNICIIQDIKVNEKGTMVKGRMTSSRKATDYDKKNYNGYVQSSWWIRFVGKNSMEDAKKLVKGTFIVIPKDAWNVTSGEEYDEKKYSPTLVQIFDWKYYDKNGGKKSDEPAPEDEYPF